MKQRRNDTEKQMQLARMVHSANNALESQAHDDQRKKTAKVQKARVSQSPGLVIERDQA
jgi:hypothetical protein